MSRDSELFDGLIGAADPAVVRHTADAILAALVDSSQDAIVSKYLSGRVRTWNRAAEQLFGYRSDEMIGQPIHRIIPPELWTEEDWIIERILAGERIDHYESARLRKDGSRVHVSLSISPIRDGSGRIVGAAKIARDVSTRRKAEEERRALERRVRAAFDHAGIGMALVALDGRFIEVNAALSVITGYSPAELVELNLRELAEGSELPIPLPGADGQPIEPQELRFVHRSGRVIWVCCAGSRVRAADGDADYFVLQIWDITARKRSEQLLEHITQSVPVLFGYVGADEILRFANRRFTEWVESDSISLGRSLRECLGEVVYGENEWAIRRVLGGHRVVFQKERVVAAGRRIVEHVFEPDFDSAATVQGFYVVGHDITDLHQSREQVRALARTAVTMREDEQALIAVRLHEGLAQDLFAVRLGVQYLRSQTQGRAGATAACEEIDAALNRALEDLRNLSNDLHPEVLDQLPLARALEQHLRPIAARAGLRFDVFEAADFPALKPVVQTLLFRIAQEAVRNVIQHAQASAVQISLASNEANVLLTIADDGIGIREAARAKSGSLGLLGIEERLRAVGGELLLRRTDPCGTALTSLVPRSAALFH